jgi:hypothetical protein
LPCGPAPGPDVLSRRYKESLYAVMNSPNTDGSKPGSGAVAARCPHFAATPMRPRPVGSTDPSRRRRSIPGQR